MKKRLRAVIFLLVIATLCLAFLFSAYLPARQWLGAAVTAVGVLCALSALAMIVSIFRSAGD